MERKVETLENGSRNITPLPPFDRASSRGCVTMHPAHVGHNQRNTLWGWPRETIPAKAAAIRIRKNGE